MTLNEYLSQNDLTDTAFGAIIGRDRTTVMRWRRWITRPDWVALEAILMATGGAVTPNDFMPPQSSHQTDLSPII